MFSGWDTNNVSPKIQQINEIENVLNEYACDENIDILPKLEYENNK